MEIKKDSTDTVVEQTPVAETQPVAVVATGEASLGSRVGAYLIDLVLAIAVVVIVGKVSGILANVAFIGYLLTRDSMPFLDGQSIGKKVLKIKAVTEEGATLSGNWNPGLIRNAVLLIPFFPLVELIIMMTNKDKPGGLRRLGDQWAKTKVINAPA